MSVIEKSIFDPPKLLLVAGVRVLAFDVPSSIEKASSLSV
jgi:hypothetical protein